MSLFFWRGVAVAERESANELKEMVLENNIFAARLGARTLEKEIESLFRLIEEEAKSSEFEKLFTEAIDAAGNDLLTALIEDGSINTQPWITHHAHFDDLITTFPDWLNPASGVIKAIVTLP